jgi:hypothetical protein
LNKALNVIGLCFLSRVSETLVCVPFKVRGTFSTFLLHALMLFKRGRSSKIQFCSNAPVRPMPQCLLCSS